MPRTRRSTKTSTADVTRPVLEPGWSDSGAPSTTGVPAGVTIPLSALADPTMVLEPVVVKRRVRDAVVRDANAAALTLVFGADKPVLGQPLSELSVSGAGWVEPLLAASAASEVTLVGDVEVAAADGTTWWDLVARPSDGMLVVTWHDVTSDHETRETNRRLVENSREIIVELDPDGVLTWVSPTVTPELGWLPSELLGKFQGGISHPDVSFLYAQRVATLDVQGFGVSETRLRDRDGSYHHFAVEVRNVIDGTGAATSRIASLRNIDKEVAARAAMLGEHQRFADALQAELDPHVILHPVRDDAGAAVDFVIMEANFAALAYNHVTREEYIGARLSVQHPGLVVAGLVDGLARTVETGEPLILDDFIYTSADSTIHGHYDIRAVRLGPDVSYTWRDVTARVDLTDRYRLLAENASDVVFRTDLDYVLEWVSPSVSELLGVRPDQLIGRPVTELFHPEDLEGLRVDVLESPDEQSDLGELRVRTADGGFRWVAVYARPVVDADGNPAGYVGSAHDAEATRVRREELAASEARYRLLVENASDVVVLADGDGVMVWASESVTALVGWRPDDLVGHQFMEFVHPDDVAGVEVERQALLRGYKIQYETRVRTSTGGYRWVSIAVHDVVDPVDDSIQRVASWRDAQSEVESRQAVVESETQYRLLAENASDVVALIDAQSRFAWVSPSVHDVLGWEPGEVVGRPAGDFILAGDLDKLFGEHPSAIGDVTRVNQLRFRMSDGTYLWVSARSAALSDNHHRTNARVVSFRDVSAEVTAREALMASEVRYRTLAENVSDVVLELDRLGAVRWASPSLRRVLGWRPDESVGRAAIEFVSEEDRPAVQLYRDSGRSAADRGTLEVRYLTADGAVLWMACEEHVVNANAGDDEAARVVALFNIDTEVATRESLARAEEHYRLLAENASDVVLQTDVDGVIRWISPSVQQFLGWAWKDLIGTRSLDFVFAEDAPKANAFRTLVAMGQQIDDYEVRCRSADGELRWVSVRARPVRNENGEVTGAVFSLRDCQGEVLARRALTTLSQGSRVLTRAGDEVSLLERMCQVAVDEGGYQFAWYGRKVVDADFSVEKVASSVGHRDYLDRINPTWGEGPLGMGPTGRSIRLNEVIVVKDIRSDARFSPWLEEALAHGFRGSLSVPVVVDGEVDGAFMVYAREPDAFGPDAVALFGDLANEIGFGLQRCRDQARLAQSQADQLMLNRAIEQAVESVLIMDKDFRIIYANPSALRTSGYSIGELMGQRPGQIFGSSMYPDSFYDAMWEQLNADQAWHGTFINRRKTGELYEEEANISPIHDADGALVAFVEVKHDVTSERKLQSDLTRVRGDRDAVLDVMREIRPASTLEATTWLFCDAATRLADIDVAAVLLIESDRRLRPIAISGANIFGGSEPFSTDEPEMFESLAHGPFTLTLDPKRWTANPHLNEAARAEGIVDVVLAPIRWEGRLIAALVVGTRNPEVAKDNVSRFAHFEELGAYAGTLFGAQAVDFENRNLLRAEVGAVLSGGRFHPVFQPFVDLTTGEIVGYEALTRFDDGRAPDARFRDAHEVGRGTELEAACAAAALEAARQFAPGAFISVNFSPSALLDGRAARVVREANRQVVIEITEHARIDDYAEVRAAIDAIGGIRLAVDDAGSGFTSLSHIVALRPDYVKLDISLVRDVDTDAARRAMVAGMCHFAQEADTIIVAEGVETPAEADTLRELGVTLGEGAMLAQGYFFGRPTPAT